MKRISLLLVPMLALLLAGCGSKTTASIATTTPTTLASSTTSATAAPRATTLPPSTTASTRTPTTMRPPGTTAPPTTAAPTPTTTGCYIDPEGNCYKPGEYCPKSLYGQTVQGASGPITCEDNDGWRWEPA